MLFNKQVVIDAIRLGALQQYADTLSKDPSRKVGCAVYRDDTNLCVAKATNYLPNYLNVTDDMCKVIKSSLFTHAERACFDQLSNVKTLPKNCAVTVYLTTLPCVTCATMFAIHTLPIKISRIVCIDNCSTTFKARHNTDKALDIIREKYELEVYTMQEDDYDIHPNRIVKGLQKQQDSTC